MVPYDAGGRMWDPALGAGVLLDMGIYPLTFARLMLGPYAAAAAAGTLAERGIDIDVAVAGAPRERRGLGRDRLDDLAHPAHGLRSPPTRACSPSRATSTTRRTPPGRRPAATPHRIEPPSAVFGTGLGNEAAHVQDCLREGLSESPLVPRAQTLELLGVMDDLRRQLGVRYAADRTGHHPGVRPPPGAVASVEV